MNAQGCTAIVEDWTTYPTVIRIKILLTKLTRANVVNKYKAGDAGQSAARSQGMRRDAVLGDDLVALLILLAIFSFIGNKVFNCPAGLEDSRWICSLCITILLWVLQYCYYDFH